MRVRAQSFQPQHPVRPCFFADNVCGVARPAAIGAYDPHAPSFLRILPRALLGISSSHRPCGVWRCQAVRLSRGCLKDSVKTIILQTRLFQSIAACSALQCPTASRPGRPLRCSVGAARRVVGCTPTLKYLAFYGCSACLVILWVPLSTRGHQPIHGVFYDPQYSA